MPTRPFWLQHKLALALVVVLSILFAFYIVADLLRPLPVNSKMPHYPKTIPAFVTNKGSFGSIGERYMNACLENIFGVSFTKVRPTWLINPKTGRSLELDSFNADLKVAGEYNGRQHYVYTPYLQTSEEDFRDQQYRDRVKQERCKEFGVTLVVVPYTVEQAQMQRFIYDALSRQLDTNR